MISVTVESRMVWRKEAPREVLVPEGTQIQGFLAAIGESALQEHALLVIGKEVCPPDRVLQPGDAVILLSVISGG